MTKEDIIKPENLVAKKPTLMNDNPMHYCPGCSHGVVHKLIAEVIEEMGLEDKAIGISPRKPPTDVRPHLPLPPSAFGRTAWCSLTKETATWLVSVLPKPSTP